MREHCRAVFSQAAAAQNMTPEELKKLTPFPNSDWQLCITLSSVFSGAANANPGNSPAPAPSGAATPTPMDTPLPPELPVGPQSLEPNASGPLTTGQSVETNANAQSPSAAPTADAPVGNIPERPPQYWTAEGGTQGQWAALREHCRAVFSQVAAAQTMSPEELKRLTPYPNSDWQYCTTLSGTFSGAANANPGNSPAPAPSGAAIPTPMDTPLPPELPVGPQSLEPTGQSSFAGGGASACQNPPAPNVGPPTPPLDVAADVSPLQNVELLNQGLWVFDKSGNVQGRGPESLYAFWCGKWRAPCRERCAQPLRIYMLVTLSVDIAAIWS